MDLENILPKDGPPINEVTKYIESIWVTTL